MRKKLVGSVCFSLFSKRPQMNNRPFFCLFLAFWPIFIVLCNLHCPLSDYTGLMWRQWLTPSSSFRTGACSRLLALLSWAGVAAALMKPTARSVTWVWGRENVGRLWSNTDKTESKRPEETGPEYFTSTRVCYVQKVLENSRRDILAQVTVHLCHRISLL